MATYPAIVLVCRGQEPVSACSTALSTLLASIFTPRTAESRAYTPHLFRHYGTLRPVMDVGHTDGRPQSTGSFKSRNQATQPTFGTDHAHGKYGCPRLTYEPVGRSTTAPVCPRCGEPGVPIVRGMVGPEFEGPSDAGTVVLAVAAWKGKTPTGPVRKVINGSTRASSRLGVPP